MASKANSENTTTRRAMLGTLATAAAVAIPATSALALSQSTDSAAIDALGEKLQQQWAKHALNRPLFEAAHDRGNELVYQALIGQPRELNIDDVNGGDEYWAVVNKAREVAGLKAAKIDEKTADALYETARQIEALAPASISDLAVVANVCAYTNPDLWECPPEDLDWDVQFFRMLVDHVLRIAGKTLILEGLPIPQAINQDAYQRAHEYWKSKEMSDKRKREIAEAALKYEGDFCNDPFWKVYHSTAARVNCSEKELHTAIKWAEVYMAA